METKKFTKWLIGGLAGLIIARGTISDKQKNVQNEFHDFSQLPKIVQGGHAEYNKGDLVSYDFVRCSAVVFDYGDCALMAHAVPLIEPELFKIHGAKIITAGSVVDYLSQESEKLGFDSKKADAYVSSGDEESLDKITQNLRERQINIVEAKLRVNDDSFINSNDRTTILYSPSRNKLSILKESGFPDYRESAVTDGESFP